MGITREHQAVSEVAMQQPFETVITRLCAPLRDGLAGALVATDFRIVASASDARDLSQTPLSRNEPILLIVDASNKHDEAVSQIKIFKKQYPSGRVAVIANHYSCNDLISAYRAGANAYFTKAMSCDSFLKTLELIMLGQTILPPELLPFIHDGDGDDEHARTAFNGSDAQLPGKKNGSDAQLPVKKNGSDAQLPGKKIETDAPPSPATNSIPRLSVREKCILRCVIDGYSNKSIARKIDITEATVKAHVKAIFRKIRVNNRTQAAIWAIDNSSLIWSESEGGSGVAINGRGSYATNSVARIDKPSACERAVNGHVHALMEMRHPVRSTR